MLTLETILNDSIWVVKMQGWRETGTYAEMERYAKSEECRDFDLCAKQPEHLKEFYDWYFEYTNETGFQTVQDFYKLHYSNAEAYARRFGKVKRVWTEGEIRDLLQTNNKMLYRSLMKLYEQQTDWERLDGVTTEANGKGFNAYDAEILTSFAKFLERTGFLTDKQIVVARKKLVKYTKQLTKLANAG